MAYDNGVEFATTLNTFTSDNPRDGFASEELFERNSGRQSMIFPSPGVRTTVLEWNEGTQHFEIVDFMGSGAQRVYGGIDSTSGRVMCIRLSNGLRA